jgi:hypothetical protein
VIKLYTALLRLYPRRFRAELGAEMRAVLVDVLNRAAERNMPSLAAVCMRELWNLMHVLFREHGYQVRQKEKEAMSVRVDRSSGWTLWLRWVLASSAGTYLGVAACALAALIVAKVVGGGAEDRFPTDILLGAGLGIGQWFVLRRRIPGAGRWMWASVGGAVVASVLRRPLLLAAYSIAEPVLGPAMGDRICGLLDVLSLGACLGLAQWLVLRPYVYRGGWWLMASLGGYGLAMLPAGKGVSSLGEVIAFLVVPPAVTGLVLVRLLRHSPPESPDPAQRVREMTDPQPGATTDDPAPWRASLAAARPEEIFEG